MTDIESRLNQLGLTLPAPPVPVASYVPYVQSGQQLFIAGQITLAADGVKYIGKIGREISPEDGKAAAQLCALNVLAQLKAACGGDWSRVRRAVKVNVYINATEDFIQHPQIANGASDLLVAVLGDIGKHARAAIGASSLPRGVAVEVDAIFEIS